MSANTSPIFSIVPHIGMVRIATANTGRDGSGTLNDLITGATNGTRVDRIVITAQGTTTAGMIRFYINDGVGPTIRFWKEVPVTAVTPTGSTQAFTSMVVTPDAQNPLCVLPSGYKIQCAPNNAETFDVIALGGDF
jgi:hypothetical protein